MQRHILLFLIFTLVAILSGCGGGDSPTGSGAQMTVKEPEFNFGYTSRSVNVSHAFWLYSTGEDTLRITKVRVGCGCTKAPLQRDVLPPGDSTALEVTYTSSGIPGHSLKTVNVYTNEDTVDYHQLAIKADIIPWTDTMQDLRINPYRLRFSNRGSKKLRVGIDNGGDAEYHFRVAYCPPELSIECPEVIAPGSSADLTVNFVGAPFSGTSYKSFTLEALGPDSLRFSMPVMLKP